MQGVTTASVEQTTQWQKLAGLRAQRVAPLAMVAVAIGIFVLALVPRVMILSAYLTTDEGNWMGRTALFTQGLLRNDPVATYQSGHPGVTTMWTALAGMGVDRALGLVQYVRPDGLERAPDYL